jgi:hypothetical protein
MPVNEAQTKGSELKKRVKKIAFGVIKTND